MNEFKRLTNDELNDFLQRAVVQLCPELTRQLLSIGLELAQYRDKIENKTLIELPCKVGDIVWELDLFSKQKVREIKARNILQIFHWIEDESFGKYLFLTKAEAEEKLKELKGKVC